MGQDKQDDHEGENARPRQFRTVKMQEAVAAELEQWRDYLMNKRDSLPEPLRTILSGVHRSSTGRAKYVIGMGSIVDAALDALRRHYGIGPEVTKTSSTDDPVE